MPDQPKSFPNEYTDFNLTSTGLLVISFGFNANRIKLVNDGPGAMFVSLKSTSVAQVSTGSGFKLSSGETFEPFDMGVGVAGMQLAATSTGATGRLGAWG